MTTERPFERSHSHLTFTIDLKNASPRFWMLLGEARSKCDHIRFVPLEQALASRMHILSFAKGVAATTAIEGNTLSEEEVAKRIEGHLDLPKSKEYLGIEVDNIYLAYNDILDRVRSGERIRVSAEEIKKYNALILARLEVEDHVVPGEFRTSGVTAGTYLAAPAADVPYLVERLCGWLEGGDFDAVADDMRIPMAFVKAVTAHVYLEWIHPFGDGNGRLGRLIEFLVLIGSGVPTPAAHLLTNHYNDTRTKYIRELNGACRSGGDLKSFLSYAAQGFVDGLTDNIKRLHKQQEQLMWRAIVDEAFIDQKTLAGHRRRLLATELGKLGEPHSRSTLRHLTPELAEAYADRTNKTLTRDINRLKEVGFVVLVGRGQVRAAIERVRGMRPFVATDTARSEAFTNEDPPR